MINLGRKHTNPCKQHWLGLHRKRQGRAVKASHPGQGLSVITEYEDAAKDEVRRTTSQVGANMYAPRVGTVLYGHAHLHVCAIIDNEDGYALSAPKIKGLLDLEHDLC